MTDEIIKLILDMGQSGANVAAVQKALEALKTGTASAAQGYEDLERQVGTYVIIAQQSATAEDRAVQAAMELTQAQRAVAQAIEQTSQKATQTHTVIAGGGGGKGGNLATSALQASYAFQDFTSVLGNQGFGHAIASVQNNIPLLLTSLGAGAGLAGVVSIVSVGVGLLIDNWDKLTNAFGVGRSLTAIPAATDRLQALTETIRKQGEELDELRKKRELDGRELARYTELVGRQAQEQDRLATARAARSVQGETDQSKKYGAAFRKSVAERGGSEALLGDLIAMGVDETTAERMIAASLHGSVSDINAIMRRTAPLGNRGFANAFAPNDPVRIEENKRADERFGKQEAAEKQAKERAEREQQQAAKRKASHDKDVKEAVVAQEAMNAEQARRKGQKDREDFFRKGPSAASMVMSDQAAQQRYAIYLQQRLGSGELSPRGEQTAQQRIQVARNRLGENFPDLMNQSFENQSRLNSILSGLQRKGAQVGQQIRQTQQQGQTAMNMGAPF